MKTVPRIRISYVVHQIFDDHESNCCEGAHYCISNAFRIITLKNERWIESLTYKSFFPILLFIQMANVSNVKKTTNHFEVINIEGLNFINHNNTIFEMKSGKNMD